MSSLPGLIQKKIDFFDEHLNNTVREDRKTRLRLASEELNLSTQRYGAYGIAFKDLLDANRSHSRRFIASLPSNQAQISEQMSRLTSLTSDGDIDATLRALKSLREEESSSANLLAIDYVGFTLLSASVQFQMREIVFCYEKVLSQNDESFDFNEAFRILAAASAEFILKMHGIDAGPVISGIERITGLASCFPKAEPSLRNLNMADRYDLYVEGFTQAMRTWNSIAVVATESLSESLATLSAA
jgi:hypothetical protein